MEVKRCRNCKRRYRCNRVDRFRNMPCTDWRPKKEKVEKAGYCLMMVGAGTMGYVAMIYGSGAELTWPRVAVIVAGALIALVGDKVLKEVEEE